jgi:hypothetical protein
VGDAVADRGRGFAADGVFDGVPDLLVFAGGQHEARQLQNFVGWEVLGDS